MGQLTDVAVSTNLEGASSGPIALVGSTDGYLYAVDPCAGKLRWALSFGSYVGSPVLADLDGSGKDQIFVSVADGYLYALKNQILPAPSFVYDINPTCGVTDREAPFVETTTTLYATWAAVLGATSYEVAAADASGAYLTKPAWIDVGAVTRASIPNLPLADGAKYYVGVRAVCAAGRSPDTSSPGVVVSFSAVPDAGCPGTGGAGGAGGGTTSSSITSSSSGSSSSGMGGAPAMGPGLNGRACTCSTPGTPDGSGAPWALFALAGALAVRRRQAAS